MKWMWNFQNISYVLSIAIWLGFARWLSVELPTQNQKILAVFAVSLQIYGIFGITNAVIAFFSNGNWQSKFFFWFFNIGLFLYVLTTAFSWLFLPGMWKATSAIPIFIYGISALNLNRANKSKINISN